MRGVRQRFSADAVSQGQNHTEVLAQQFGERWDLTAWDGMQGHNWGREHAFEYAWGQCFFPAGDGAPEAILVRTRSSAGAVAGARTELIFRRTTSADTRR